MRRCCCYWSATGWAMKGNMTNETEIEELKRRHYGQISDMMTLAGLPKPAPITREDRLAAAAIEAKAAFDRGEVGEAHRILNEAM